MSQLKKISLLGSEIRDAYEGAPNALVNENKQRLDGLDDTAGGGSVVSLQDQITDLQTNKVSLSDLVRPNTLYVKPDPKDGSLEGDGSTPSSPLFSVKKAVETASAGTSIQVSSGIYEEEYPINVKEAEISVVGESLRNTVLRPKAGFERNSVFYANSGFYFTQMLFEGHLAASSLPNEFNSLELERKEELKRLEGAFVAEFPPARLYREDETAYEYVDATTGFGTDLYDGGNNSVSPVAGEKKRMIFKSPYAQNATTFTTPTDYPRIDYQKYRPGFSEIYNADQTADPLDVSDPITDIQTRIGVAGARDSDTTNIPLQRAGGGLKIDGEAISKFSPIRSMVVDSFTQIDMDGIGCAVVNDGYAQLVSFFGIFCYVHVWARQGGIVNLTNSTTDFGTYGLVAEGRSKEPLFTTSLTKVFPTAATKKEDRQYFYFDIQTDASSLVDFDLRFRINGEETKFFEDGNFEFIISQTSDLADPNLLTGDNVSGDEIFANLIQSAFQEINDRSNGIEFEDINVYGTRVELIYKKRTLAPLKIELIATNASNPVINGQIVATSDPSASLGNNVGGLILTKSFTTSFPIKSRVISVGDAGLNRLRPGSKASPAPGQSFNIEGIEYLSTSVTSDRITSGEFSKVLDQELTNYGFTEETGFIDQAKTGEYNDNGDYIDSYYPDLSLDLSGAKVEDISDLFGQPFHDFLASPLKDVKIGNARYDSYNLITRNAISLDLSGSIALGRTNGFIQRSYNSLKSLGLLPNIVNLFEANVDLDFTISYRDLISNCLEPVVLAVAKQLLNEGDYVIIRAYHQIKQYLTSIGVDFTNTNSGDVNFDVIKPELKLLFSGNSDFSLLAYIQKAIRGQLGVTQVGTEVYYELPSNKELLEVEGVPQNNLDASAMIRFNKDRIVAQVLSMDTSTFNYPNLLTDNPDKCERDLGFYLEAITLNLKFTGNNYLLDYGTLGREALLAQVNSEGLNEANFVADYTAILQKLKSELQDEVLDSTRYNSDRTHKGTGTGSRNYTLPEKPSEYAFDLHDDTTNECASQISAVGTQVDIIIGKIDGSTSPTKVFSLYTGEPSYKDSGITQVGDNAGANNGVGEPCNSLVSEVSTYLKDIFIDELIEKDFLLTEHTRPETNFGKLFDGSALINANVGELSEIGNEPVGIIIDNVINASSPSPWATIQNFTDNWLANFLSRENYFYLKKLVKAVAWQMVRGGNSYVYEVASEIKQQIYTEIPNLENTTLTQVNTVLNRLIRGDSNTGEYLSEKTLLGNCLRAINLDYSDTDYGVLLQKDSEGDNLPSFSDIDIENYSTSSVKLGDVRCTSVLTTCVTYFDIITEVFEDTFKLDNITGAQTLPTSPPPYSPVQQRMIDAGNIINENLATVVSYVTSNLPSGFNNALFDNNPAICARDLTSLARAIAWDIQRGGNEKTVDYARLSRISLDQQASDPIDLNNLANNYVLLIRSLRDELVAMLDPKNYSSNPDFDINYDNYSRYASPNSFPYSLPSSYPFDLTNSNESNCANARSAIYVFSDIIEDIFLGQTVVKTPHQGVNTTTNTEYDGSERDLRFDLVSKGELDIFQNDAAAILELNKSALIEFFYNDFTANEANYGVPAVVAGSLVNNETLCKRDLGFFIDSLIYNLRYSGNDSLVEGAILSRIALIEQADASGNPLSSLRTYYSILFNRLKVEIETLLTVSNYDPATYNHNSRSYSLPSNYEFNLLDEDSLPSLCAGAVSAVNSSLDLVILIIENANLFANNNLNFFNDDSFFADSQPYYVTRSRSFANSLSHTTAFDNFNLIKNYNRSQITSGSHTMEYVGSGVDYNALPWFGGTPITSSEILERRLGSSEFDAGGAQGKVFATTANELGNFDINNGVFRVSGVTGEVTFSSEVFNLSNLNAIGPFKRNGLTVGVTLEEVSDNPAMIDSINGIPGRTTVPTQNAVVRFLDQNYGGATSISIVGVVDSGVWQGEPINGLYLDLDLLQIADLSVEGGSPADGDIYLLKYNENGGSLPTWELVTSGVEISSTVDLTEGVEFQVKNIVLIDYLTYQNKVDKNVLNPSTVYLIR